MLRLLLLITGVLIVIAQWIMEPFSAKVQFVIFLIGIIILGIPHGAADFLVATQNAKKGKQIFSNGIFFATYLSRLVIFGLLLYFFPVAGLVLFLLFAAYHFGETDLHFFNTSSLIGKILVSSYGLVILSVILLNNTNELLLLIQLSGFNIARYPLIGWIVNNHNLILSGSLVLFFGAIFLYFFYYKQATSVSELFLVQFALLVFILFNMPLLVGFTFYFIVWHSILSLQNITRFLKAGVKYSYNTIIKQILFYSFLAFMGILFAGSLGFMFINSQSVIIYIFIGLAVLTAPHMQVMHSMYSNIRSANRSGKKP